MKQDYTMYIYKRDGRYKGGERRVRTQVCTDQTDAGMQLLVDQLLALYPAQSIYRYEWFPAMKTVKNLMTGKDIQIASDTPHCCDPSSETFWSM